MFKEYTMLDDYMSKDLLDLDINSMNTKIRFKMWTQLDGFKSCITTTMPYKKLKHDPARWDRHAVFVESNTGDIGTQAAFHLFPIPQPCDIYLSHYINKHKVCQTLINCVNLLTTPAIINWLEAKTGLKELRVEPAEPSLKAMIEYKQYYKPTQEPLDYLFSEINHKALYKCSHRDKYVIDYEDDKDDRKLCTFYAKSYSKNFHIVIEHKVITESVWHV